MLVEEAAAAGLHANICRFSSVYGCPHDHPDRVAMAFALAAAGRQDQISIEGANNTFDFTAIRDIADGLWRLIEATDAGESLPPIHFVSGHGTTLGDLAQLAVKLSSKDITVGQAPPRSFDVSRVVGDASRALSLIVWTAKTDLRTGFEQLVRDLAQAARHPAAAEPM
jgi:dTDP-glucose 4,6-dehydratase/UDP-glucose 4-epimerase